MYTEMTADEAIEMATMMNAMNKCADTANYSLISNGQGSFLYTDAVSTVVAGNVTSLQGKALTRTADWSPSAYRAVKNAYLEVTHVVVICTACAGAAQR